MEKKLNLTVKSNTIVNQLVDIIQERIISGKVKPGMKMSEPSLSKEFGISRVPIREALIILEGQGLIRKTYSGREVISINSDTLKELFEIKIALETFVVYRIAGHLSTEQENNLSRLITKIKQYANEDKKGLFRTASADFHDSIITAFGNKKITELYKSTVQKIRWTTSISLNLPHRYELTVDEHTKIFIALKGGNAEKAMKTIMEHSTNSMNRILKQLSPEKSN